MRATPGKCGSEELSWRGIAEAMAAPGGSGGRSAGVVTAAAAAAAAAVAAASACACACLAAEPGLRLLNMAAAVRVYGCLAHSESARGG